jgi:hypothetical protein
VNTVATHPTPTGVPKAVLGALTSMALGLCVAVFRSILMRDWSHPTTAIVPVAVLSMLCVGWLFGLWRRLNWLRWTTIVLGALGCMGARWSLELLHDPIQIDLYWVQFVTTLLTVTLLLLPASRNWYVRRVVS